VAIDKILPVALAGEAHEFGGVYLAVEDVLNVLLRCVQLRNVEGDHY
jgi:hypothetical protein